MFSFIPLNTYSLATLVLTLYAQACKFDIAARYSDYRQGFGLVIWFIDHFNTTRKYT
jgi:hypothetical protein